MRTLRAKSRKGFTLIELLVVVLILAILMSVALPLYLSAIGDAQKKTCRANMQTIANAVQASKVRTLAGDYSAFIGAVSTTIELDLTTLPVCPNGGVYSIAVGSGGTNSTFKVSCTAAGHGTFEPGKDSS